MRPLPPQRQHPLRSVCPRAHDLHVVCRARLPKLRVTFNSHARKMPLTLSQLGGLMHHAASSCGFVFVGLGLGILIGYMIAVNRLRS